MLKRHPLFVAWLTTLLLVYAVLVLTGIKLSFWQGVLVICAVQAAILIFLKAIKH